jgi:hypothetical protein
MVRYGLFAIIILLAGCAPAAIEVTGTNNHIQTPNYSIVVPPDQGWHQIKEEGDSDLAYFKKSETHNDYIMRFSTNWIARGGMSSWTAKQVADDYRAAEYTNMLVKGVMAGKYLLSNVVKGEEKVGNKHFYTMTYTTTGDGVEQNASVYLYFPVKRGVTRFLVALYSESYPLKKAKRKSYKHDFLQTLNSLKMGNER